jgi:hypothetical protein
MGNRITAILLRRVTSRCVAAALGLSGCRTAPVEPPQGWRVELDASNLTDSVAPEDGGTDSSRTDLDTGTDSSISASSSPPVFSDADAAVSTGEEGGLPTPRTGASSSGSGTASAMPPSEPHLDSSTIVLNEVGPPLDEIHPDVGTGLDAGAGIDADTEASASDDAGLAADANVTCDLDTDGDGQNNCVDLDDDDDGIPDIASGGLPADYAPLDPALPMGSPTSRPGSVLRDPCVIQALAQYEEQRLSNPSLPEIVLHKEHLVPDLTGYYHSEPFTTNAGSTKDATYPKVGWAIDFRCRRVMGTDDTYEYYDSGDNLLTNGDTIRGNSGGLTRYKRHEGGHGVSISSFARVEPLSGDLIGKLELWVEVEPSGVYPTGICSTNGWWESSFQGVTTRR